MDYGTNRIPKMYSYEETWWYQYRRAKNRPKPHLNLEMIFRKSFKAMLKEYASNSSSSGVRLMCEFDINKRHRLVWILFFAGMFGTVIYFLQYLWFDALSKPLIVTMDSSTYPISKIDFPAIAMCNNNRISKKAASRIARMLYSTVATHNESIEEVEWFVRQSGRLLDYAYNDTLRNHNLLNAVAKSRVDTHIVIKRMRALAPNCDEMLIKCAWAGELVNCSDIFDTRRTVKGHCCAFNYVLDYNSAGRPDNSIADAFRQTIPGAYHGLNVVIDPMLDDYAYPLSNTWGFDVFIYDPTHFADPSGGRVMQRFAEPNMLMTFELQSTKQVANTEVRKYPVSIRKCLFHDEIPEGFGNMYSYSACVVECRIRTIRSLCKCTPYFLPIARTDGAVCSLDDLQCLNKYREKLLYLFPNEATETEGLELELQDSLYCPECLPDCEFTRHMTKSSKIPITITDPDYISKGFERKITHGINLTNMCMIRIYQTTSDGVLDRLDVVVYWFEILSNIGGVAGMLVGFSLIGVIEIIYFITVRFVQIFCMNLKMHY